MEGKGAAQEGKGKLQQAKTKPRRRSRRLWTALKAGCTTQLHEVLNARPRWPMFRARTTSDPWIARCFSVPPTG